MTSENQLREIAATAIREHLVGDPLNAVFEDVCCEQSWDPEEPDAQRIRDLILTWPILDLPVPDRDGYWWPEHGRNYGNVRHGVTRHPERGEEPYVRIGRGLHPITMTRAEALELASLLTATAMEEP